MSALHPPFPERCIAVFDLDGTLTWRDTLLPFLAGYLLSHPRSWLRLWRLPAAVLVFCARRDRGALKSRVIRALMGGETRARLDAWADRFVANLRARGVFRPAALAMLEAHRSAGDALVLMSASPDLYVPRIGALLGFDRIVCTQLKWRRDATGQQRLDGTLLSANVRGEEKSRCLAALRELYPHLPVAAYGNSLSDLPHLKSADRALLVNGSAAARRSAAAAGIAVADWR